MRGAAREDLLFPAARSIDGEALASELVPSYRLGCMGQPAGGGIESFSLRDVGRDTRRIVAPASRRSFPQCSWPDSDHGGRRWRELKDEAAGASAGSERGHLLNGHCTIIYWQKLID